MSDCRCEGRADATNAAIGAVTDLPIGAGIEKPETINNHAANIASWIPELGRYATNVLRPAYGDYYGFEYSTPKNAEMVTWFMFAYR